ncbi:AGAP010899-PA-like protein [Anopheles sinensis]|uniref:AGAP010899-PA-like protein n=1 Tax=Anopheles sinensis TaxID=74873 RepID=A0A084V9X4_ANOSI|nr:AGAP010899-PA-like protein [Anopheles sinensis]
MKCYGILIVLVVTVLKEVLNQCTNSPYRTFGGSCNNLQNPTWGSVNTPFSRLIPANYGDGKSSPPGAKDGTDLPNARLLSVEVFEEDVQNSPDFTLVNMQFGQVVAHDMALTRGGLLGQNYMQSVGLQYATTGFSNDYNSTVNPSVINSHTASAFRFFHSSIQGILKFYEESRKSLTKIDINDHTNNPTILEQTSDRYPNLLHGMTTQPMGLNDASLDPATKHFLFRFNNMFGVDLKALDIQRGRDHGLPRYNNFAYYCYKKRAST